MASKLAALIDTPDLLAGAGLAVAAGGIWMIYPPAALIFVGLILMLVGVKASAAG